MSIGHAMLARLETVFPNMLWSYDGKIPDKVYGVSKREHSRFHMQFGFTLTKNQLEYEEFYWSIENGERILPRKSFKTFSEAVEDAETWASEVIQSLSA